MQDVIQKPIDKAMLAVREKLKEIESPENIDALTDDQAAALFNQVLKKINKKTVGKFGYHIGGSKPTLEARKLKYKKQKKNQKLARRKNRS